MSESGARGSKVDRLFKKGIAAHQAGDFKQAERWYREILAIKPKHPDALRFLAMIVAQRGDASHAFSLFRRALEVRPGDPLLHVDLGNVYLMMQDPKAAESSFRKALVLSSAFAPGHHGLGVALERQGQFETAADSYRQAVSLAPDFAAAHLALGGVLHDAGRLEEAIAAYRRALALNGEWSDARFNLGRALADLGLHKDAEREYRLALNANPDAAAPLLNLASALMAQSKFVEAKATIERVLEIDPSCIAALFNLSMLLHRDLQYSQVEECYERILAIDPADDDVRTLLAGARLAAGNFGDGWQAHVARRARRQFQSSFPEFDLATDLPRDLTGKTVVLIKEQGLGDELFFLRFARQLKARGATLVYRASPQLTSILGRTSFIDEVDDRSAIDVLTRRGVMTLIGDLPLLCTDEITPAPVAFTALPERVASMRARLRERGSPPYRAVTWRGGTAPEESKWQGYRLESLYKEVGIPPLAAALRETRGTWVALQRKPRPGEIEKFERELGRPLHDFTACNDDLEDVVALLTALDGYVGVSNTNTHLCAGLGKLQHMLIPWPPEWRWTRNGTTSPWFPNFPIFRQRVDGDWTAALAQLAASLKE